MSSTNTDDLNLIDMIYEENFKRLTEELPSYPLDAPDQKIILAKTEADADNVWRLENMTFKSENEPQIYNQGNYSTNVWQIGKRKTVCPGCKCLFKGFNEVQRHYKYCSKRTEVQVIPKREEKKCHEVVRKFKCSLCNRRYRKYRSLFKHQVQECEKRYRSKAWIVKI